MPPGTVLRRPPRRVVLLLLVLAGLLVVWAAVAGWLAREQLLVVRQAAVELRAAPPDGAQELADDLVEAAAAADRADDLLSQPGPWLVSRLPLVGRSLAAERDVAEAADVLLADAGRVLDQVERLQVDGGVDVEALRELSRTLDAVARRADEPLQALVDTPTGLTPGVVRDAVREARDALGGLQEALPRAAAAARAVTGILGGDGRRTVVVLVMNNAELRGAGGYGGSFAVAQVDRGRLRIGPFQDVNEVQDPPDRVRQVEAPPDVQRRYGPFLADTTLWKNALMSADQPSSASVVCAVAQLAPGVPCDAVVLLDVPALASLVELSGPVSIDGSTAVEGDELVEALLVEAYADADSEDVAGAQQQRRQALRQAADRAVVGLLGSDLGSVPSLRVLADAVAGRHVALWSAVPDEQRSLVAAGLAGSVVPDGDDLNLVSVNQLSAGKLDYYVDRRIGVRAVVGAERVSVTQRLELELDHPDDLPGYVLGVNGGRLDELVDIAVSRYAEDVRVLRDGLPLEVGLEADSGSRRVEVPVRLVDGQRAVWEVRYTVPVVDGRYVLELLPQPLARDAELDLEVVAEPGARLEGGEVRRSGPFDRQQRVEVSLEQPSWWDREVRLPWAD